MEIVVVTQKISRLSTLLIFDQALKFKQRLNLRGQLILHSLSSFKIQEAESVDAVILCLEITYVLKKVHEWGFASDKGFLDIL